MKTLARILAPLALLEWGGIFTYFYFSGRIAAFLHPSFRGLALVAGILLIIIAVIVAVFHEETCEHETHAPAPVPHDHEEHEHDHEEHEHDHEGACSHEHHHHEHHHNHEDEEPSHSHGTLSFGGLLSFLVLLLPMALATTFSTDSYSANLISNRGTTDTVAALPGVADRFANRAPATPQPQAQPEPKPASGNDLPTHDTPTSLPVVGDDTATATNDASSGFDNPYLKPNKDGNLQAEVIDLLYAAEDPLMRKEYDGKRVEMIGQYVPNAAGHSDSFKLVRLFMVCCAADVQPLAVKIEPGEKLPELASMGWIKVVGTVEFEMQGSKQAPKVKAVRIDSVAAPEEQYVY